MKKTSWLDNVHIRPYVFARKLNRPNFPGSAFEFPWFHSLQPLILDPLEMQSVNFANQVMLLDQMAFSANGLVTPRWVFYDCAVMPGIIAGFAAHVPSMDVALKKTLQVDQGLEWAPLSLFITIPTPEPGRWMAFNLSSMNSLVEKSQQLRGLGFLSKAYALWFTNIRELYGVAQWTSHALKLHANYGPLEIITAYTPIHEYAGSITYRVWIDTDYWVHFLDKDKMNSLFYQTYEKTDHTVCPKIEETMKELQTRIERGEGPFYIDPHEILSKESASELHLYKRAF